MCGEDELPATDLVLAREDDLPDIESPKKKSQGFVFNWRSKYLGKSSKVTAKKGDVRKKSSKLSKLSNKCKHRKPTSGALDTGTVVPYQGVTCDTEPQVIITLCNYYSASVDALSLMLSIVSVIGISRYKYVYYGRSCVFVTYSARSVW